MKFADTRHLCPISSEPILRSQLGTAVISGNKLSFLGVLTKNQATKRLLHSLP